MTAPATTTPQLSMNGSLPTSNGAKLQHSGRALPPGIYCPTVCFFKDTPAQELDIDMHTKHIEFLAKAGIQGVTVQGSTGESVALDRDEKKQVSSFMSVILPPANSPGHLL